MPKSIKPGLEPEGEDAARFKEYIENPMDTPKGKVLMERAARLAKQLRR